MSDTILSIIMLAALVLSAGGIFLWRKGEKKQARLMLILAFVMLVNIAIWLLPIGQTADGLEGDGSPGETAAT